MRGLSVVPLTLSTFEFDAAVMFTPYVSLGRRPAASAACASRWGVSMAIAVACSVCALAGADPPVTASWKLSSLTRTYAVAL